MRTKIPFLAFVIMIFWAYQIDAQSINTVTVQMELPAGGVFRADTLLEGETYKFTGFAHPFQYLNGGELTFPEGSLPENITLSIQVPDFATVGQALVSFGDSIASAVTFNVIPQGSNQPESPYRFNVPLELTLPVPANLPAGIGEDVSAFVLAYRDTTGNFDTTGISTRVRDAVLGLVSAQVEHFSDIAMTSEEFVSGESTNADVQTLKIPGEFVLYQNYPNPFNSTTIISYELPQKEKVSLNVYDINGRLVKILVNEEQQANFYTVSWKATDESGDKVSSGIYFIKLSAGPFVRTHRMILMR